MADYLGLLPAVFLLSVIFYVLLVIAYQLLLLARFSMMMRSLAYELAIHYNKPLHTRPPVISGVYQGRHVAVDYVDDCTRVRVFHGGEVEEDFTVGTVDHFKAAGQGGALRLDFPNREFDERYRISGGSIQKVRKFLDTPFQAQILSSGASFTVGRFDVSYAEQGRIWDKKRIVRLLDFLVVAAARADHL